MTRKSLKPNNRTHVEPGTWRCWRWGKAEIWTSFEKHQPTRLMNNNIPTAVGRIPSEMSHDRRPRDIHTYAFSLTSFLQTNDIVDCVDPPPISQSTYTSTRRYRRAEIPITLHTAPVVFNQNFRRPLQNGQPVGIWLLEQEICVWLFDRDL